MKDTLEQINMEPIKKKPKMKNGKLWMLLLVWPGAPQIAQKRWSMGCLLATGGALLALTLCADIMWQFNFQFWVSGEIPRGIEDWFQRINWARLGIQAAALLSLWILSGLQLYFSTQARKDVL